MTNAQREFWLQFAGAIVRKLLVIAGTALAGHGWISSEQADGLTTATIVEFVLSLLLLFGSTVWTWAKVKFNIGVVRQARDSPADTPIGVITAETLSKEKLITSV
jgi:hypothetical protein